MEFLLLYCIQVTFGRQYFRMQSILRKFYLAERESTQGGERNVLTFAIFPITFLIPCGFHGSIRSITSIHHMVRKHQQGERAKAIRFCFLSEVIELLPAKSSSQKLETMPPEPVMEITATEILFSSLI